MGEAEKERERGKVRERKRQGRGEGREGGRVKQEGGGREGVKEIMCLHEVS